MSTPPKKRLNRGRLTEGERQFILANAGKMSISAISDQVRRDDRVVKRVIEESPRPNDSPAKFAARVGLRESHVWKQLKQEFAPDEVRVIEEEYAAIKAQFQDDILATEERQLLSAAKSQVLIHRNLVHLGRVEEEMDRLQADRRRLLRGGSGGLTGLSDEDRAEVAVLDTMLERCRDEKASLMKENGVLNDSVQSVLKSLKATREQRISKIESSKRSFVDLIRELQAEDAAAASDRMLDLVRRQAEKEVKRLGRFYKFPDSIPDRPLMNAETVGLDDDVAAGKVLRCSPHPPDHPPDP